MHRCAQFILVITGSLLAWPRLGEAQSGEVGAAEVLFRQARDLLDAGNPKEACPKFAESFRLDPATGTLLGLAMCHEKEGKLASAWGEYVEVEGRANRDGDAARRDFAREQAAALQPRLSTVAIEVPSEVAALEGMEVRRNGATVGQGAWNVPVPLDGGDVVVEASAPGKKTWSHSVVLAAEGQKETVTVPALEDAPLPDSGTTSTAPIDRDSGSQGSPFDDLSGMQWAGVGAAGVGVVALGAGGYFLATSLGQNSDSESECEGTLCTPAGSKLRSDAVSNGNLATVFGIAGTVLVGSGVTLFFVGDNSADAARERIVLHAAGGPEGLWATVNGSF